MIRKNASKRVRLAKPTGPQRLALRITLRHIEPLIWREISVPDSYTLLQLHRCIQLVFGWLDYHLFEFQIGSRRFEAANPDAEGEDAASTRLRALQLIAGSSFLYVYDMGDYWEHDIAVRKVTDAPPGDELDPLGYLVDGERAAPPEDVGGPPGYEHAMAAFVRQADGDDKDLVVWLGPDFDPELFDRRAGNHALMLATAWSEI